MVVSQQRGLAAQAGANLVTARPDGKALFDLVSEVRALIRAIEWPRGETYGEVLYKGCTPVTTYEGFPLDAYRLSFELLAAIPDAAWTE